MFGDIDFADRPFGDVANVFTAIRGVATVAATFEYTIFAATKTFATEPTDTPPNKPFRGVLESYTFTRSLLSGGAEIGVFGGGSGQLEINNTDAFYDFLVKSYAVDGRDITLKIGRSGDSFGDYFPVAVVTASNWNIDESSILITLEDSSYKLRIPALPNIYGGTGDADGGSDIAGKRKPRALGYVLNAAPILINASSLIYQLNDGPINAISAVYDRGAALTAGSDYASYAALAAATIGSGTYGTCLAAGLIRLNANPAGLVTVDLEGDKTDGTFVYKSADIVKRLITSTVPSLTTTVDDSTFTAVNTAQPAQVGYWIGPDSTETIADVAANIMGGVGGWVGFRRSGRLEVGLFTAPGAVAVQSFTKVDFVGGVNDAIKREPLPSSLYPPPWRWRVPYKHIWEVQSSDIAGSVTASRKALIGAPYQLSSASDATILTDHPRALDADPVGSYFNVSTDADTEAARLLALYRQEFSLYRMRLPRRAVHLNLGETIHITHTRFDLSAGRYMTVVEISEHLASSDSTIDYIEVVGFG